MFYIYNNARRKYEFKEERVFLSVQGKIKTYGKFDGFIYQNSP